MRFGTEISSLPIPKHRPEHRKDPPKRLGVLPGTFNPPTIAHLALAGAALDLVDQVLFVLPRQFPHKSYAGASFEERYQMVAAAIENEDRLALASTETGLFIQIAGECRLRFGNSTELMFICGRDAAERIVNWDYGRVGAFGEMLSVFGLLVAARQGEYQVPEQWSHRILPLPLDPEFDGVSATEVRRRIAVGERWEHLIPEGARELARRIYT